MDDRCDIFGCLKPAIENSDIEVEVAGLVMIIDVCSLHDDILSDGDPAQYSLGLTYLNEIELRIHPSPLAGG